PPKAGLIKLLRVGIFATVTQPPPISHIADAIDVDLAEARRRRCRLFDPFDVREIQRRSRPCFGRSGCKLSAPCMLRAARLARPARPWPNETPGAPRACALGKDGHAYLLDRHHHRRAF